jgi:hypothetical protein
VNQARGSRVFTTGVSLWYAGNLTKKVLVRKATQLSGFFKSDQNS